MSNDAITWVARIPRGTFTPPQRAIMNALANLADQYGKCYPGVRYLMQQTEMSERTIRAALGELVEAGHLEREARARKDGSQTSNRYRLLGLPIHPALEPDEEAAVGAPSPTQQAHHTVQQAHPQEEPSLDPSSSYEETRAKSKIERSPGGRRKPELPLPADWSPTPEHVEYAATAGYDLAREVDAFRHDAIAKDRRYREWNSAFAKWLRSPYAHNMLAVAAPVRRRRNLQENPVY